MWPILLQLSLLSLSVIQLTTSQPTNDVTEQDNGVSSCGRTEQLLNQLVTMNSQLLTANSQLRREIAELKAATLPQHKTGRLRQMA